MMNHHIEQYKDFGDCLCISNGMLALKIPLKFGIRIIYCALEGKGNIFYELPRDADYLCTEEGWRIYGGHRIWLAPEGENSYYPDNRPISYTIKDGVLRLDQQTDKYTNVQKSLEISFSSSEPDRVRLRSIVKNVGKSDLRFGIWTISAMASGARLSVPFKDMNGGFAPGRNISLWGDTELCDPRLSFNPVNVNVNHAPDEKYFKLGLWCSKGFAQCVSNNQVLEKQFEVFHNASYPDNNVNIEIFQCRHMMEFELLGPMVNLKPGEKTSFSEEWRIFSADEEKI